MISMIHTEPFDANLRDQQCALPMRKVQRSLALGNLQVGHTNTEQTRAETGIETSYPLLLKDLERSLDHGLFGVLGRLDGSTRRDTHERVGGRHGDHTANTAGASMDEGVVRHCRRTNS